MTPKSIRHLGLLLAFFSLAAALVLAVGCAAKKYSGLPAALSASGLVWPAPPEPARVAYVTQIRGQHDLFASGGVLHKLGEMIGGKADTSLVRPAAVALHPAGGLLVADPGRPCVFFFDWSRRRTVEIGPRRKGGLPSPVGVAALPDGRILVSDSRLGSVEAFSPDGRYIGPFCPAGSLNRPAGIAVNPARGEVYVVDVPAHAIKTFNFSGALIPRVIGGRGDAPAQFNFPTHLALDPQGRLLITDSLNFRVQTLTPEGQAVSSFGQLGDRPGAFSKPKGVAADSEGNIIVVEGLFDALQFFDPQGRLLLSLGRPGHGPGEFWLPSGLCYDAKEGLLFVADSYNKRIQVFRMLGAPAPPAPPQRTPAP